MKLQNLKTKELDLDMGLHIIIITVLLVAALVHRVVVVPVLVVVAHLPPHHLLPGLKVSAVRLKFQPHGHGTGIVGFFHVVGTPIAALLLFLAGGVDTELVDMDGVDFVEDHFVDQEDSVVERLMKLEFVVV